MKEQVEVLTGARDQLMESIQTLKQSQSDSSKDTEETLLMLNEKNQGLQESLNALTVDRENTRKELKEKDGKVMVSQQTEVIHPT